MRTKSRNCKYLNVSVQAKSGNVMIVSMTKSILNLQCGNAANGKLSQDALPWQVGSKNCHRKQKLGMHLLSAVLCEEA